MYMTLKDHLVDVPQLTQNACMDLETLYKNTKVTLDITGEISLNNAIHGVYIGPPAFSDPTLKEWTEGLEKYADEFMSAAKINHIEKTLVDKFQLSVDQEYTRNSISVEIRFLFHVIQPETAKG